MSAHLERDAIAGIAMLAADDPERAAADAHAERCEACRAALGEASARLAALDAIAAPPPSDEALARARDAVLARMREEGAAVPEAAEVRRAAPRERPDRADADPEPEVARPRPRASIATAAAIAAAAIVPFALFTLLLEPLRAVQWEVGLGLAALIAARTALALVRGGARSELFALGLGVGAAALLVGVDAHGGGEGQGVDCVLVELGAAALPLGLALVAAWRGALRVGPLGMAAVATAGALAGELALRATCPDRDLEHLALFHAGGVVIAALLGAAASQLPIVRPAPGDA